MRTQLVLAATLSLLATPSFAQTAVGTGVGVSESNSAALSAARANGNTINISPSPAATSSSNNSRTEVSGTQTVKNVPSMVAPGLTAAGLETCLGSASGGVSAVGFGITGGSTYRDEDCTARLDARTLYAMGLRAASVARLCARPDMWRAMPAECQRYWPPGVPYPAGIVVAAPGAAIVMSTDTGIRVIDGRDGIEKNCLSYSHSKQKCHRWEGDPMRKRTVAVVKPPKKPVPPPPAEAPKPET